jgi:beta-glucosidase/6-phospho-beta-glucosidase/beta-galactosidase
LVSLPSSSHIPSNIHTGFPVFGEAEKDLPDQLFDTPRSIYYLSYLSEVLKSIWEDGVEVAGAFAWSFADNWEFGDYDAHFGIQTVNRTTQERRYKKSFFDMVDFVNARTL